MGSEQESLSLEGGKRRIDRVLSPQFVRDLPDVPVDELKRRRDEALAEREYLSLLRRMVHGRLDIVRLETKRRTEGGEGSLVDQLTEALVEPDRGTSRGEALRVAVPEASVSAARRRVERMVGDTKISDPSALSDEELLRAERRLTEEERMVSKARKAVIDVHDRLQDELKRRYKEDPSLITAP
jgi:anti-sigma-K factor RsiG